MVGQVVITTITLQRKDEDMREVFTVMENPNGGKDRWVRIGVCFPGEKGDTVILNALPINGRLFIKAPREDSGSDEVPF